MNNNVFGISIIHLLILIGCVTVIGIAGTIIGFTVSTGFALFFHVWTPLFYGAWIGGGIAVLIGLVIAGLSLTGPNQGII